MRNPLGPEAQGEAALLRRPGVLLDSKYIIGRIPLGLGICLVHG